MATPRLALSNGTIYTAPDRAPVRNGTVLIEGRTIAAVHDRGETAPWNAGEVLDCTGCAILAGFWNSHVHFFERKWADAHAMPAAELDRQLEETFTRFGFTAVFDTGSQLTNTFAVRDRIEACEVRGPRVYSTGEALLPPGALPSAQVLGALGYMHFPSPEIANAQEAGVAAAQLLGAGADGIKIFPSSSRGTPIPLDAIAAAAHVARSSGKPAFAHPDTAADIRAAIRGGVNVIAHTTPRSGEWDDALIAEMLERGVAVTPTLQLWNALMRHDRASVRERYLDVAVGQLRAWHASGGTVLFGTDLGATDPDPAPEYALMSAAGMSFTDVLASLTTVPASTFGAARAGRIAAGCDADIVVVYGDPARDLHALCKPAYVIRNGRVSFRAQNDIAARGGT